MAALADPLNRCINCGLDLATIPAETNFCPRCGHPQRPDIPVIGPLDRFERCEIRVNALDGGLADPLIDAFWPRWQFWADAVSVTGIFNAGESETFYAQAAEDGSEVEPSWEYSSASAFSALVENLKRTGWERVEWVAPKRWYALHFRRRTSNAPGDAASHVGGNEFGEVGSERSAKVEGSDRVRDRTETKTTNAARAERMSSWRPPAARRFPHESYALGVHLGTTNSSMATIVDGEPFVIPNAEGELLTPSVVAITGRGERLVGRFARRQAVTNPENTIFSIKRFLGRKFNDPAIQLDIKLVPYKLQAAPNGDVQVKMGDRWYSPQEVSAMILQKLKADAEAYLDSRVDRAVITVPAYFDVQQRELTKAAAKDAGFNVERIISESTASAWAHGLNMKQDQRVVVYDFGGGSYNISVLDFSLDRLESVMRAYHR